MELRCEIVVDWIFYCSVLRETFHLKQKKCAVPDKVWFVWSCRTVDDLLWCWDTLTQLLIKEANEGRLDVDSLHENSSMFDW